MKTLNITSMTTTVMVIPMDITVRMILTGPCHSYRSKTDNYKT